MNTPSPFLHEDLNQMKHKIVNGHQLSRSEAEALIQIPYDSPDFVDFLNIADYFRRYFLGNTVELCSIINAKSGKCTEDCKFCAQSSHYDTAVETYNLMAYEPILSMAKENETAGVHRFSLVLSGRGIEGEDLETTLSHYRQLNSDTSIALCASLGLMNEEDLCALKKTGVTMYHHNLESGRSFYDRLCSTHSYGERIDTLRAAKSAGLHLCSGGIIGMGETWADRLDLIFTLRELGVVSVPVNILNPILGTPFEKVPKLSQEEILKTIALFRWIHPTADIRLGGGRHLLERAGQKAFTCGASATITGNYLTTTGQDIAGDKSMFESLGLPLKIRK